MWSYATLQTIFMCSLSHVLTTAFYSCIHEDIHTSLEEMGLIDLPPRPVLMQESSVALLEQNTATSKRLISELDASELQRMDLSFSTQFLTLC